MNIHEGYWPVRRMAGWLKADCRNLGADGIDIGNKLIEMQATIERLTKCLKDIATDPASIELWETVNEALRGDNDD